MLLKSVQWGLDNFENYIVSAILSIFIDGRREGGRLQSLRD